MSKDVFRYSDCTAKRSMALMGSRWKPFILYVLRERHMRFGQIAAVVGEISRKVLTQCLKELEAEGIILREENSSKIEYSLTAKGMELLPIIIALVNWDVKHYHQEVVGQCA